MIGDQKNLKKIGERDSVVVSILLWAECHIRPLHPGNAAKIFRASFGSLLCIFDLFISRCRYDRWPEEKKNISGNKIGLVIRYLSVPNIIFDLHIPECAEDNKSKEIRIFHLYFFIILSLLRKNAIEWALLLSCFLFSERKSTKEKYLDYPFSFHSKLYRKEKISFCRECHKKE